MRHIGTLIAALLIAPFSWVLIAFGQDQSVQVFADAQTSGVFDTGALVHLLELLAGAGLLLGVLATLRLSPLGAVATGFGYALSFALMLFAPTGTLRLLGHGVTVAGRHIDLSTPVRNGTTLILGALMLVAVVSVGRWRRWPQPEDEYDVEDERDRPVGLDGLDLDPPPPPRPRPRPREPIRVREPERVPEPEPEYADAGWRESGFRPVPVSGVPSPWGGRFRDRARW